MPVAYFEDFYANNSSINYCFVNDGSKDETIQLLNNLKQKHERVDVLNLTHNVGKAEAIRQGMLYVLAQQPFTHLAYFDADFSAPLNQLNLLIGNLKNEDTQLVFGSRIKRIGAEIDRTLKRHILGRVFSTFASIILKLPVYDTQCGAKLISADLAKQVFAQPFLSRWLFDIEIFARVVGIYGAKLAQQKMVEVPLTYWKEVGNSRLKFGFMLKVPFELWRIKKNYSQVLAKP